MVLFLRMLTINVAILWLDDSIFSIDYTTWNMMSRLRDPQNLSYFNETGKFIILSLKNSHESIRCQRLTPSSHKLPPPTQKTVEQPELNTFHHLSSIFEFKGRMLKMMINSISTRFLHLESTGGFAQAQSLWLGFQPIRGRPTSQEASM